MKKEAREDIKAKMLEKYKKSWIIGSVVAAIGAGVGGYFSAIKGSYIYTGIGAFVGYIVGALIGIVIGTKVKLHEVKSAINYIHIILAISAFLLAIAGIIGFILTKKWVGLVGAIFFGLCGIYLLKSKE